MRIVLTGAGRGLGLEFARQWLTRGDRVFALARTSSPALAELASEFPDALSVVACDVASEESVQAAAREVAAKTGAIDLLVNNAGVADKWGAHLEDLDWKRLAEVYEVNAIAPLRVARAFLPLLAQGEGRKLVQLSTLMGSIADNGSGGAYGYRMSKAALNMANKNLAIELAPRGIVCLAIHPGWVKTDMGGSSAPLEALDSITAMIATIDRLKPEQSGAFVDRFGKPLPW